MRRHVPASAVLWGHEFPPNGDVLHFLGFALEACYLSPYLFIILVSLHKVKVL